MQPFFTQVSYLLHLCFNRIAPLAVIGPALARWGRCISYNRTIVHIDIWYWSFHSPTAHEVNSVGRHDMVLVAPMFWTQGALFTSPGSFLPSNSSRERQSVNCTSRDKFASWLPEAHVCNFLLGKEQGRRIPHSRYSTKIYATTGRGCYVICSFINCRNSSELLLSEVSPNEAKWTRYIFTRPKYRGDAFIALRGFACLLVHWLFCPPLARESFTCIYPLPLELSYTSS